MFNFFYIYKKGKTKILHINKGFTEFFQYLKYISTKLNLRAMKGINFLHVTK